MNLIIKITLGILAAFSLMFVGRTVMSEYALKSVMESADAIVQRQNIILEKKAEKVALKKAEVRKIKLDKVIRANLVKRKEREWNNFYKAPKSCSVYESDEHMKSCVNSGMKARRVFEVYWSQKHPSFVGDGHVYFSE